ncbi:MAG: hypothetical protein PHT33_14590, partial [bacterium]|nr:hypothetical protein [bacterium]
MKALVRNMGDDYVSLTTNFLRMLWTRDEGSWRDRLEIKTGDGWMPVATSSWHACLIRDNKDTVYLFQALELVEESEEECTVKCSLMRPDCGGFSALYRVFSSGCIEIRTLFEAEGKGVQDSGLEFLRFKRPQGYDRVR